MSDQQQQINLDDPAQAAAWLARVVPQMRTPEGVPIETTALIIHALNVVVRDYQSRASAGATDPKPPAGKKTAGKKKTTAKKTAPRKR